jgi:hypothetical protein
MGVVMIKCPRTGEHIQTGMLADPGRFACAGFLSDLQGGA